LCVVDGVHEVYCRRNVRGSEMMIIEVVVTASAAIAAAS
jgi:hypothetical protein